MGDERKKPTGIKIRDNAIQIFFRLKGETDYCYETLPWSPTPTNINRAGKLRAEIISKIKNDIFVYGDYFPNSCRAQTAQGTFAEYAQVWLDSPTNDWTESSRDKFKGILQRVWMPGLYGMQVRVISQAKISEVLVSAVGEFRYKNKKDPAKSTYNDWLLCIRGVVSFAIAAGALRKSDDPTQHLQNKVRNKTDPDPFDIEEADTIIELAYEDHSDMWGAWFEVGFYSGMRYPSEPSALTWDDIDLRKGEVRISKIMTKTGEQNTTKTRSSRILFLNSRSINALERLKPLTHPTGGKIFINEQGGDLRHAKTERKVWREIITKLEIRYRDMYNMRHTYATFGLMSEVNPAFMAEQLGHSVEEFFKTYAKWINKNHNKAQMDRIEKAILSNEHRQQAEPFPYKTQINPEAVTCS